MSEDATLTRVGLPGGVLTLGTWTGSPISTSVPSSSDTSSVFFSDTGPTSTASSTQLQTLESTSTTTAVIFSPFQ
uniref:Uncharacterized protein n=1 Tax=Moniliophthora roreri TaxID=221103 RepID=A0A0W0ETC6_MONRR